MVVYTEAIQITDTHMTHPSPIFKYILRGKQPCGNYKNIQHFAGLLLHMEESGNLKSK